ncbi:MAG TPA: hypothetical protein VFP78_08355, partial [Solirubrobacteraceae bacterium]|nr:hypothetical protein [Solirubrobacteraceae bacterium]
MRPDTALDTRIAPRPESGTAVGGRRALTVVGRDVELVVNGNASGTDAAETVARATRELSAAGARGHARV